MDFDPFEEIGSSERRPPDKEKAMQAAEEALNDEMKDLNRLELIAAQEAIKEKVAKRVVEDPQVKLAKPVLDAIRGIQPISDVLQDTILYETYMMANQAYYTIQERLENSDNYRRLMTTFNELQNTLQQHVDGLNAMLNAANEIKELAPFLQAELDARAAKDPAYKDITLDDLLEEVTAAGDPTTTLAEEILKAARTRKAKSDGKRAADERAADVKETGAIQTIGQRLLVPTEQHYIRAFTTTDSPKARAGLFRVIKEDGTPSKDGKGKRLLATDIEPAFIQALAKAIYLNIQAGGTGEIQLDFVTLSKELGLDLHKYKAKESNDRAKEETKNEESQKTTEEILTENEQARADYVLSRVGELQSIWGTLPSDQENVYALISVHAYNTKRGILTIDSPFLKKMLFDNMRTEQKAIESGKQYYIWKCDLLHSTAVAERNKAAVEMATRILVGVQRRGTTPDAKEKQNRKKHYKDMDLVTWSISFAGLIQDCPQIMEKLKAQKTKGNQTVTLQRATKAMYKILKTKTDLFKYYKDLTIVETVPTMTSLNSEITITHHGQNPGYKLPPLPPLEIVAPPAPTTQEAQEVIDEKPYTPNLEQEGEV